MNKDQKYCNQKGFLNNTKHSLRKEELIIKLLPLVQLAKIWAKKIRLLLKGALLVRKGLQYFIWSSNIEKPKEIS